MATVAVETHSASMILNATEQNYRLSNKYVPETPREWKKKQLVGVLVHGHVAIIHETKINGIVSLKKKESLNSCNVIFTLHPLALRQLLFLDGYYRRQIRSGEKPIRFYRWRVIRKVCADSGGKMDSKLNCGARVLNAETLF